MVEIQLGDTVQCIYTGAKGVAVGKTEFINGCVQYLVAPPYSKGSLPEELSIDEGSLKIIKKGSKYKKEESNGGPTSLIIKMRGY